MSCDNKKTSKTVASKAGQILRDKRYSEKARSVAGSALAQVPRKTKPKK